MNRTEQGNRRRAAAIAAAKDAKMLALCVGPDEGFLNWRSSPHVMWLLFQLAGQKKGAGSADASPI
jgi:hypothetical protein